jgi:hypothetical protein
MVTHKERPLSLRKSRCFFRGILMKRPLVTQKNVHLFIPNKVAKICSEMNRTQKLSLNDSILKFYNSQTYETLSRESSKLWQEGWVYIYQMMSE